MNYQNIIRKRFTSVWLCYLFSSYYRKFSFWLVVSLIISGLYFGQNWRTFTLEINHHSHRDHYTNYHHSHPLITDNTTTYITIICIPQPLLSSPSHLQLSSQQPVRSHVGAGGYVTPRSPRFCSRFLLFHIWCINITVFILSAPDK